MQKLFALSLMILVLARTGCTGDSILPAPGVPLASFTRDTVWLDTVQDGGTITWTTAEIGGRSIRWRSGSLFGALPDVRLLRINEDSLPDLFFTLDYEEFVGGMVVLASSSGAGEAFRSKPQDYCRVPELKDVNGDGRLDLVSYRPSALARSECHGDPLGDQCRDSFLTEWAVPHIQMTDGFLERPELAKSFYSRMSQRYEEDSRKLRQALSSESQKSALSPLCDAGVVRRLEQMRDSARMIASQ